MDNVKTETMQGKPIEPIALLDCGKASEQTKGLPFLFLWEFAPSPFDRTLLI